MCCRSSSPPERRASSFTPEARREVDALAPSGAREHDANVVLSCRWPPQNHGGGNGRPLRINSRRVRRTRSNGFGRQTIEGLRAFGRRSASPLPAAPFRTAGSQIARAASRRSPGHVDDSSTASGRPDRLTGLVATGADAITRPSSVIPRPAMVPPVRGRFVERRALDRSTLPLAGRCFGSGCGTLVASSSPLPRCRGLSTAEWSLARPHRRPFCDATASSPYASRAGRPASLRESG